MRLPQNTCAGFSHTHTHINTFQCKFIKKWVVLVVVSQDTLTLIVYILENEALL